MLPLLFLYPSFTYANKVCNVSVWIQKKPEDFNLPYLRERDLAYGIPFLLAAGALANLRKLKEVAMLPLLFLYPSFHLCKHNVCNVSVWIQKNRKILIFRLPQICGEKGIRTPGTFPFNGFQDRRIRPLCHLSFPIGIAKVDKIFNYANKNLRKNYFNISSTSSGASVVIKSTFKSIISLISSGLFTVHTLTIIPSL